MSSQRKLRKTRVRDTYGADEAALDLGPRSQRAAPRRQSAPQPKHRRRRTQPKAASTPRPWPRCRPRRRPRG
eukprot:5578344-Pyramimonas_sp.AAC.1